MVDSPEEPSQKQAAPGTILIYLQGILSNPRAQQHVNRILMNAGIDPGNAMDVPAISRELGTGPLAIRRVWEEKLNILFVPDKKYAAWRKVLIFVFSQDEIGGARYDPVTIARRQGHQFPPELQLDQNARHIAVITPTKGSMIEGGTYPSAFSNFIILLPTADETVIVEHEAAVGARVAAHLESKPLPPSWKPELPPLHPPPVKKTDESAQGSPTKPTPIIERRSQAPADKPAETPPLPPQVGVNAPNPANLAERPSRGTGYSFAVPRDDTDKPTRFRGVPSAGPSHPPPSHSGAVPKPGADVEQEKKPAKK
jgi:hypothetical protein